MILEIGNILVSSDILTEKFCCDLSKCRGRCCIEGEAGAPVNPDEIAEIEAHLASVRHLLDPKALEVIDRQGVSYTDPEGTLVTSIVNGKDCVFTRYDDIEVEGETVHDCCLCAFQGICKPISCYLYPIREKTFHIASSQGEHGDESREDKLLTALNYNRWDICQDAVKKGNELGMPVYKFLREPLIRRFGKEWYDELCQVAHEIPQEMFT